MPKSSSWIYHYTNGSSAKKIILSKKLKTSKGGDGDIKLGVGVYMTKLTPDEHSDEQLFYNNYGAATLEGKSHDDVQYYIKMPAKDIGDDRLICRFRKDRDIYVWSDSDIDLSKTRFSVGRRKGGNIDWELRGDNMYILVIDENENGLQNSPLDVVAKYKKKIKLLRHKKDKYFNQLHNVELENRELERKNKELEDNGKELSKALAQLRIRHDDVPKASPSLVRRTTYADDVNKSSPASGRRNPSLENVRKESSYLGRRTASANEVQQPSPTNIRRTPSVDDVNKSSPTRLRRHPHNDHVPKPSSSLVRSASAGNERKPSTTGIIPPSADDVRNGSKTPVRRTSPNDDGRKPSTPSIPEHREDKYKSAMRCSDYFKSRVTTTSGS